MNKPAERCAKETRDQAAGFFGPAVVYKRYITEHQTMRTGEQTMKKLSYQTLKETGYNGYLLENAPEKVLQFGEGNFLRAFVDYFFDVANEKCGFNGKVVLCQPIAPGLANMITSSRACTRCICRGFENGQKVNQKRVISAVSRCLNPYEDFGALLACAKNPDLRYLASQHPPKPASRSTPFCRFDDAPPASFPGKLTRFLYERYNPFRHRARQGLCDFVLRADRQQRQRAEKVRAPVHRPVGPVRRVRQVGGRGEPVLLHAGGPALSPATRAPRRRDQRGQRLRGQPHRHGRGVRLLGHRGPALARGRAAVQKGRPAGHRGGRPHALQKAQGAHPERRAHLHGAGGVPGGQDNRAQLHAGRGHQGLHGQDRL